MKKLVNGIEVDCTPEEIAEFQANNATAKTPEEIEMISVRSERDALLEKTDWWVLPDRIPTQAQLDYRQALRDITNTCTSLDDVVWPEKPE